MLVAANELIRSEPRWPARKPGLEEMVADPREFARAHQRGYSD
jgi:hypothetical protein